MRRPRLASEYDKALHLCKPYVVAPASHWDRLDLSPFDVTVAPSLRIDPTRLASQRFLTWIERLDAMTFGPQAMAMPRWVFYDCAEWPSALFGLAARPSAVSPAVRERFEVAPRDRVWVPVSLHVAIPTVRPGEFFEHNVGSIGREVGLRGLGTFTKALGCRLLRVDTLVGAAQWTGRALGMHLRFGPVEILTAFTPAHSYARTLTYRHATDTTTLTRVLSGEDPPTGEVSARVPITDASLTALQRRIERGARYALVGVPSERPRGLEAPVQRLGDRE